MDGYDFLPKSYFFTGPNLQTHGARMQKFQSGFFCSYFDLIITGTEESQDNKGRGRAFLFICDISTSQQTSITCSFVFEMNTFYF